MFLKKGEIKGEKHSRRSFLERTFRIGSLGLFPWLHACEEGDDNKINTENHAPALQLLDLPETWQVGQKVVITWESSHLEEFKISYAYDEQSTETSIGQYKADEKDLIWTAPDDLGKSVILLITDIKNNLLFTSKPIQLSLNLKYLDDYPRTVANQSIVEIKWSTKAVTLLTFEVVNLESRQVEVLKTEVPTESGVIIWRTPEVSGEYEIVVRHVLSGNTLDNPLPIMLSPASLTLIEPVNPVQIRTEGPLILKWEASHAGTLKITYRDNFGLVHTIADAISEDQNEYIWTATHIPQEAINITIISEVVADLMVQSADIDVSGYYLIDLRNYPLSDKEGEVVDIFEAKKPSIALIRQSTTEIKVISRICTHAGCTVNWENKGEFVCPCHNSRYDACGVLVRGVEEEQKDLQILTSAYNVEAKTLEVFFDRSAF